ncbi:hypothetical protein THRCLA_11190 [Thraustotheca clavata]|uniref:Uncharacterized protein n=1 Tax=Thraustotheca clavata TaxID=74557 RepID=A0A1V9Y8L2_9STRA|nr:hypothetical protein THRCLA_11190 [Thraustotheca clavata]
MACVYGSFLSLLLGTLGVLLSLVAVAMPAWSTSINTLPKPAFSAGLWGLCFHGSNDTLNNCFGYYHANDYGQQGMNAQGVCDMYKSSSKLHTLAVIEKEDFNAFMDQACGKTGKAALVIASISTMTGAFASFCMLFAISICSKIGVKLVGISQVIYAMGAALSFIVVVLWVYIASGLNHDGISFGASFILENFTMILFAVASGTLFISQRKRSFEELPK